MHYIWPDRPASWRDLPRRTWPTVRQITRLTVATVLAYLASLPFLDGAVDLTGPLTALLVVQASTYSTITMGFVRVGAVVTGILVALTVASFVGLTWWSLGVAVATGLVLSELLHLHKQGLEPAISAMLVLGVTNPEVAGVTRVGTTLIGAAVGIALNLLVPPRRSQRKTVSAVRRAAIAVADTLEAVAVSIQSRPIIRHDAQVWLDRARAAASRAAAANEEVTQLEEGRRYNPWSIGTANVGPGLRTGLESLEDAMFAVRALLLIIRNEAPESAPESAPGVHGADGLGVDGADGLGVDGLGVQVRAAFAVVLEEIARCFDAYGQLIEAEAEGRVAGAEAYLTETLSNLRESEAFMAELVMAEVADVAESSDHKELWLLHGSILQAVHHIIATLDVGARARVRSDLEDAAAQSGLAAMLSRADLPPGLANLTERLRPDQGSDPQEPKA